MLNTADIVAVVEQHLGDIASVLRPDVQDALRQACGRETNPRGREVLKLLVENAELAAGTGVPLCQDTGLVWVLIEAGDEVAVDLRGLREAVDTVVATAFIDHGLRASTVRDALNDRSNPGTNLPVLLDVTMVSGAELRIHTMLKGAGTDNASRVVMLPPEAGEDGIVQVVLDVVREKASVACPPMVVGVGVGGSFDKVAELSKRALLRPIDESATQPDIARLEDRLLREINQTGIGPAALGGDTTALAVHVETASSHIASLPVAVNLCCHSLRSRTTSLHTT